MRSRMPRQKLGFADLFVRWLSTAGLQVAQYKVRHTHLVCRFSCAGVTVNCVAPGWIDTESLSAHERAQGAATPLRRCGTPLEIASCVQWLASESASYITGQTVCQRLHRRARHPPHSFRRLLLMAETVLLKREARCRIGLE